MGAKFCGFRELPRLRILALTDAASESQALLGLGGLLHWRKRGEFRKRGRLHWAVIHDQIHIFGTCAGMRPLEIRLRGRLRQRSRAWLLLRRHDLVQHFLLNVRERGQSFSERTFLDRLVRFVQPARVPLLIQNDLWQTPGLLDLGSNWRRLAAFIRRLGPLPSRRYRGVHIF